MLAPPDDIETDAGPRDGRRVTERFCAATRTVRPITELIHFVVGPDGTVVADLKRKLPGRGVWVTANRAVVDEAVRRNVFARSFKAKVKVAPDLGALLDRQIEGSCLDSLAMAHKSGRVAIGFAKAEAALADKPVAAVIHASDAAPDGVRKLAAAVRHRSEAQETAEVPIISAFLSAQLDLALGRSNVIHAALLAGPASNGFMTRCFGLERFRAVDTGGRGAVTRRGSRIGDEGSE